MTPIEINDTITELDNQSLQQKLHYLSYNFCVNADFTKTKAVNDLVEKLEMYALEGLMRILEDRIGHRPYQNKIYENVEKIFENQDSYNINRMMSSLRRAKVYPIDPDNEKYVKWMRNRVRYAIKSMNEILVKQLETVEQ